MLTDVEIATAEDFRYGLRCMDCDEKLLEKAYARRLIGIKGDTFIKEIVCIPCILGMSYE